MSYLLEKKWARAQGAFQKNVKKKDDFFLLRVFEEFTGSSFDLIDLSDDHTMVVKDKNFLFIHKEANANFDRIDISGSGNCVFIDRGFKSQGGSIKTQGKSSFIYLGQFVSLSKVAILMKNNDGSFIVDSGSSWQGGAAIVQENNQSIRIGKNCMFSSQVDFMTSDSHPIFDMETNIRLNPAASIEVESDVWLGRGVKVNKGVSVKSGSIVGQGAIVTKDTQPHCLYAGIPARLIREGVRWERSLKPSD